MSRPISHRSHPRSSDRPTLAGNTTRTHARRGTHALPVPLDFISILSSSLSLSSFPLPSPFSHPVLSPFFSLLLGPLLHLHLYVPPSSWVACLFFTEVSSSPIVPTITVAATSGRRRQQCSRRVFRSGAGILAGTVVERSFGREGSMGHALTSEERFLGRRARTDVRR